MITHCVPGRWPEPIAPDRFAATIRRDDPRGCRVALLGLADDLGVRLNRGRPGAAGGPSAFRAALARYGAAEPAGFCWPPVYDAGDVPAAPGEDAGALLETHRRVTEAARELLALGLMPVGIGGGHDLTLPLVRAVIEHEAPARVACVYFDAHLDVREMPGSGMAFRELIAEHNVGPITCVGASALVNSRAHAEWFGARGRVLAEPLEEAAVLSALGAPPRLAVSLDLDCLDAAHAPGVSAVNPAGFPPARVAGWVRAAGASPGLRCFDVMELCPAYDESGRTARVAAHMVLSLLRGIADRPGPPA
ncbi:MAG TPA: formimidoylglutamase [Phycisphaerales bacterium]|nr:formimidoylglutamase [Phycisphaerales bacterium]